MVINVGTEPKFKSWPRLLAFHIELTSIYSASSFGEIVGQTQLYGNQSRTEISEFKPVTWMKLGTTFEHQSLRKITHKFMYRAGSDCIKWMLSDTHKVAFWVWVYLEVMAMNSYSTLPRAPEQQLHHQIQFSVISRRYHYGWILHFCWGYS